MTDATEVEVEKVDRVESDDDDEGRVITRSCSLAPFSRLHSNYRLANYHPTVEVRKRTNRQINKLFKLFAFLLRNNGLRNVEYYLVIQEMTLGGLNTLLTSCGLASWRICNRTESVFEAKWQITFRIADVDQFR